MGVIWYGFIGKVTEPLGLLSKYTSDQIAGLADRMTSRIRNTHQEGQQKHCAHQILRKNAAVSDLCVESCDPNKSQTDF